MKQQTASKPCNGPGKGEATQGKSAGAPKVKRNRRSLTTIKSILAATEKIILCSGAERVSILDVCRESAVSRGTFYRYFSSQDELLDAFSKYKRDQFHQALVEVTTAHQDPDERFGALIRYLDDYLERGQARRLLLVAPAYALGFFQRIFGDSIERLEDVLGIVFDAWDRRLGIEIDRPLVCEMLVRYVLSEQLVSGAILSEPQPRRVERVLAALLAGATQAHRA